MITQAKLIKSTMVPDRYDCIEVNVDGNIKYVPFDEANTDYQQYLAWLAEGNEPLPADEEVK